MDAGEELGGGEGSGEQFLIGADGGVGFCRRFVEKLDPIVFEAGVEEVLEKAGTCLGPAIEKGVAATDICLETVKLADAIAEVDGMLFTGAAAVSVICAGGEEGANDAMLHVKHGHVLM